MKEDASVTDLLRALEEDPFYEAPKEGSFTPTLVVGLGGTGTRVLRQLKKYLGRERSHRVRLFGIDSDRAENDRFDLPSLSDSEHCLLDPKRAITWLDRYDAGDSEYKWLSGLLQETGPSSSIEAEIRQKVQAGVGCGQRRRAGRLMFCANALGGANLRGKLTEIHHELRSLRAELKQIHGGFKVNDGARIFVTSSFAGGTGAGIVMDVLGLLRTIFDGPNDDITLIGLLPGCALDSKLTDAVSEKGFTRGNAIGVLRELDALCRPGYKRTFQFGARDRFELDSSRQKIATNVYLVDNECGVKGGAPVVDWDELISATGYFLYNFTENGVGASAFSGEVNYAPDKNFEGNNGAVYRAFGISAVRYPVDDLIRLGLFLKAGEYFDEAARKPKGCVAAAEDENKQTLNAMDLSKSGDFISFFRGIQIDEATFKQSESQWKAIKWASDDEFIGAGHMALRSMTEGLSSYESAFDERITEAITKLTQALEQRALELVTGNHAVAREHFVRLIQTLQQWSEELYDQLDKLGDEIADQKTSIAKLERSIHKLDFFLDVRHRAAYRRELQAHLANLEDEYRAGKARAIIVAVTEAARSIEGKVIATLEELKGKRLAFRTYAERYTELLGGGIFVQSGMDRKGVDDWLASLGLEPKAVPARSLTLGGVLQPLFTPMVLAMRDSLKSRDLASEGVKAGDETTLKRRLKGAKEASLPLIGLRSEAPDYEELTPQRYVLAVSAEKNEKALSKLFPGVGENKPKMQKLDTDSNTLACLNTIVGFKVADLKRFDEFYAYYSEHPWIYHTDEHHTDLPSLDPRMAAETHKYKVFGLGLFLEALESRGSNYYVNLVRMQRGDENPEFQYLVYSKDRNEHATALQTHGLVAEAPKSRTRRSTENRIGNSLEAALDALSKPELSSYTALIDDLWESFVNTIGKAEARNRIGRFAEETIDGLLAKTQSESERKEALKRVYQALLEVADGIE